MTTIRHLIATLHRHTAPPASRPFLVDLGLAAGIFCAWLALCGYEPLVAAATDELRLAISTGPYHMRWPPLGPAAIGFAGLMLAWIRHRTPSDATATPGTPPARHTSCGRAADPAAPCPLRSARLHLSLPHHPLVAPCAVGPGPRLSSDIYTCPPSSEPKGPRTAYIASALLAVCLPMYVLYALYFCQVTMLHSDEGQYLRVTQSLLHDGDMDLANNLSAEQVREFHVIDFPLVKTPAAPEGKVHSTHPIGLSITLVPAYWLGLEAWKNPRLATALFIAFLASLCVPLLYVYLTRLGADRLGAVAATGMMAITGPYFYYSNQIYPEFPAIAIVLVVLLALVHWQIPGGRYRCMGRGEPLILGLLALLLCCLPLLHPRYVPLGFLCGAVLLLQAWYSPRRRLALFLTGLVVAGGLYAVIAYHHAFSDDWLGPLRPGIGPWGEEPFDIGTTAISIPGQWLHARRGILNTSPSYFFALFGLLTLARLHDRRVLIAIVLYVATAGIWSLHTVWVGGHDLPGRFMMAALPVLAIGLAWGLPPLLRRPTTSFLVAIALAIGLESVLHTLMLPETGYKGNNLLGRSIARFYPFQMHFFGREQQDLPLLDLTFWGVLAAALFFRPRYAGLRAAFIAVAAVVPFLWGQSDTLAARLQHSRSPYMPALSHKIEPMRFEFKVPLDPVNKNAESSDGSVHARPGQTRPGNVGYSRMFMPLMGVPQRGIYLLNFQGLQVEAPEGEISGYLTLSRRYTVPAVSRWSTRSNYPLIGGKVDGDQSLIFDIDRPRLCYVHTFYTGTGELALDGIHARLIPVRTLPEPQLTEIDRVVHETNERPIRAVHRFRDLPEGHYRVRFNFTGSTFKRFFERRPAPIKTAVFTLPPPARPLVQGAHPPWWLSIPFADDEACQLRFIQDGSRDVLVLLQYDGAADLDLTDIVLYRETFGHR